MVSSRRVTAVMVCISLCGYSSTVRAGSSPPLGILTRAEDAQLNAAQAYPALSVFEGEALSTTEEGKLGVRVGAATLAFSRGAQATLQKVENGTHVDLTAGSVFFASTQNALVEVHVTDATFRPEDKGLTRAEVRMLRPRVLRVFVIQGNLEFSYRREYQLLREGETYQIELDAPGEPQQPAGAGAPSVQLTRHTIIMIVVGASAAGLTAWGIHELLDSDLPVSPSNPSKPK